MCRQMFVHGLLIASLFGAVCVSTGCATRKFTRNEVSALDTKLSTRLDTNDKVLAQIQSDAKETSEHLGAVEKLTNANTSQIANLNGDIGRVEAKANDAGGAARNAQTSADKANVAVASLEALFRDRNRYELVTEKQILFQSNSAKLREDYESTLEAVAGQLKDNPDTIVILEGRTDSVGNAAYNLQLGDRRSEAVSRYLIVNQGVPMYKVYRTSFGKDQPIATNNSKDGREKNRSVVLRVYRTKSTSPVGRNP